MFNWKEFEKNKNILTHVGQEYYREDLGQHHIELRPKDLLKWIELAKEDLGYLTLVDIAGVDRLLNPHKDSYRFELVYHLLNMGTHQRLNLHLHFNAGEIVPSVSRFFTHASWMECEQKEMLNIEFDQKLHSLLLPKGQEVYPFRKDAKAGQWPVELPDELPTLRKNPNKSETPYPEESYQWQKFGTLSPETLGNFEWDVCFNPNEVVQSQVKIGYHHQGLEKLLEEKDWLQVIQLVDKIHLGAAPTYSLAWVRTLEDILRVKLPERAQAIRIVVLELARIVEHLTVLSEICTTTGHEEAVLFLDAREKVYELFEKYCGHRQGLGIARIGGVREDLPHGWIVEYQTVADILHKNLNLINKSLMAKRNFRSQIDHAPVAAQTVLQWGISGPTMRASGLNFDLRKSQPFYFYQDIDFDVPVGIHGTSYDRYLIRFEEIHQSLRIITQVMDNLPLGETINSVMNLNYIELKEFLKTLPSAEGWHYSCLESPNGEAGFFLLPGKDLRPYRVKMKTPSFSLVQALPQFVLGLKQDQLRSNLASLGIRRFEMDR